MITSNLTVHVEPEPMMKPPRLPSGLLVHVVVVAACVVLGEHCIMESRGSTTEPP